MNALLPALNSPTTTSRNSSSSCAHRALQRLLVVGGDLEAGQDRHQLAEHAALVGEDALLRVAEDAREHEISLSGPCGRHPVFCSPAATPLMVRARTRRTGSRSGASGGRERQRRSRVTCTKLIGST